MSSEKSPSGFKNKDIENKFSEVIHELEIFDKELDESHFLSSNEVSQALFHKAPANFLKSNSSNRLAEIAKTASRNINEFLLTRSKIIIESEIHDSYTAYYIVLSDCPFIVNTIAESVKQTGSKIAYHLHPILTYDGYRASLSYLEIEDISAEHSEVFIRRLKNALENLAFVTADFTSMLVRVETLAKVLQNKIASSSIPKSERLETSDFLRWLTDGGFIFVAYSCWDIKQKDLTINQANSFGLFKADQGLISELKSQIHDDLLRLNDSGELISINKINVESPVHRFVRLTHIAVVEPGASGQPAQIHSILGILTSKGNAQESSSIPLIRQKLKQVLLLENVIENSHDFKAIADIIDSMPKVEALRLNVDSLREIAHLVLEIKNKSETRTLIKIDEANRGALVLIAMPKEQYSNQIRDRLQAKIETTFGTSPGSCEYQVDLSSKM